jgi:hypothetical protein
MADSNNQTTLELAARHRLQIDQTEEGNELRLISPDGSTPITLEITSRGVVLRIESTGIALHASGNLSLSAEHLTLQGRTALSLTSGGDLHLDAAGDLHSRAQAQVLRAEQGCVEVKASDDVKISGERVMVNCDETVDRYDGDPDGRSLKKADQTSLHLPMKADEAH